MRMTKQRKAIIRVFEDNPEKALNAEMIYQVVEKDGLNLSTVYRTVDALVTAGVINKTLVASTAYFYLVTSEHKHFMICTNCQKMIPIGCFIKRFLPEIAEKNAFTITRHDITIFGICQQCALN